MNSYSEKLRKERREELASRALLAIEEVEIAPTPYTYEIEIEDTEFGFMPPFIKANMIKGLEKKLAAETDDDKKAEIQAKIDKLTGSKKKTELSSKVDILLDEESEEFGTLPPFLKANIIKGLEKKLAAESDDAKKVEIQSKIDKLNGDKKEELASPRLYPGWRR